MSFLKFRVIALLWGVFASMTLSYAHTGFNQLSWKETLGPYTLTVLEDFHPAESSAQVLIQVSEGSNAAPAGTQVKGKLSYETNSIYEGDAAFLINGGQQGDGFYAAYLFETQITEKGFYELELFFSGPLGEQTKRYFIEAKNGARVSALEYLPSVLILLITVGGAGLLFIPVKRKDVGHEVNTAH